MPNGTLGLPMTDRFAKQLYEFFGEKRNLEKETVQSLIDYFKEHDILSTVTAQSKSFRIDHVSLASFFVPQRNELVRVKGDCKIQSCDANNSGLVWENFVPCQQILFLQNMFLVVFLVVIAIITLNSHIKCA